MSHAEHDGTAAHDGNQSPVMFDILAPKAWTSPVVFNSPHSGRLLPAGFLESSCLSGSDLRRSEDAYVDELFASCADHGAPLLRALISRAYLDLNRESNEFDQKLFNETLPGHLNSLSPRVVSGLGIIPRVVSEGRNIYSAPLKLADAVQRVEQIYRPYHRVLAELVDEARRASGIALLIDCHSMPSPSSSQLPVPDIILGDRFGSACSASIVAAVEELLRREGFHVGLNKPYAGGFITELHGRPREGRHALQIEINRALYMSEATFERRTDFDSLRVSMSRVAQGVAELMRDVAHQLNRQQVLAAE